MTATDFLPYYQGSADTIVVTSTTGLRLKFPAMHLRSYLKNDGINGYFCMQTENKKFISLALIK